MAFGLEVLSVDAMNKGVTEFDSADELNMRRDLRLVWSTEARREILRQVPKKASDSS